MRLWESESRIGKGGDGTTTTTFSFSGFVQVAPLGKFLICFGLGLYFFSFLAWESDSGFGFDV
jgi:hypothetical protein